jgi:hypothetical protein
LNLTGRGKPDKLAVTFLGRRSAMVKKFAISDVKLDLILEPAEEGGYIVTSLVDPELITEADTPEEAFVMARDALRGLAKTL